MRFSLTIFVIIAVSFGSVNGQSNSYGSKQSYLESITKGSEYNCMKTCVPQDRKIFVDENYFFGPDPRPTVNCDKDNDRAIDVNLCKMNPALTGNLSYISGAMFFFPNMTTTSKLSWHAALKACRNNLGLQMASILDEKENNAFAKFLMENKAAFNMQKDSFWTSGANFFGDDFTWMETGDRVVYTNWAGGKLSGGGKCIQIS
ncbi:Hypothetical predicted protein [Cloeon dipterum]|uniref:C-type lectin domain-containing protein n=1 Tax=Cloeon dipterum TaxID=197152 RepID=A0A8S1D3S2_9INSE|nr:Hypothetical predicted protein [Cloeon dipterum]